MDRDSQAFGTPIRLGVGNQPLKVDESGQSFSPHPTTESRRQARFRHGLHPARVRRDCLHFFPATGIYDDPSEIEEIHHASCEDAS